MIAWYFHVPIFLTGVLLNAWGIYRFEYCSPLSRFKPNGQHQGSGDQHADLHCKASTDSVYSLLLHGC